MKTVFFDVDTQLDFLSPAGALYVSGAEDIVTALRNLTRFAASRQFQIISTTDAHTEDDPEFKIWRPHCIAGTLGQHKEAATQLPGRQLLDNRVDISAPQIIVQKQKLDAFSNPNLRSLLHGMKADRYFLYGVVTELCVRCAALGLLETGARVVLVTDAIKSLSNADEITFVQDFHARGGQLTTVAAILSA